MKIDFSNKTVIVTGGTRGIGAAIVELFQQCNADVIATGTDTKEIDRLNRERCGGKLKYMHLDFIFNDSVQSYVSCHTSSLRFDKPILTVDHLQSNRSISVNRVESIPL